MDLNLRHVRAFIVVAKLGSFTRAAAVLHLSQPALTVQIRKLEEALRVKLFDRNSRSVALTQMGSTLLPVLERTMRTIDDVVTESHHQGAGRRGTVRVAALPSLAASLLPAVIGRFRAESPEIAFVVRDAVANRVTALVEADEVDIGFTGGDAPEAGLDVLCRGRDRLCVVMPGGHPLAAKRRVTLKDIVALPIVLTDSATSVRAVVEAAFLSYGRQPTVVCETTYMMTAVAMVAAGLGVTVLPGSARELGAIPNVEVRPLEGRTFARPILLVKKKGRTLSPSCDAFAKRCIVALKAEGTHGY